MNDPETRWLKPRDDCPDCGSKNLETEIAGHGPTVDLWYVTCKDCGAEWGGGAGPGYEPRTQG